MSLLVLKKLKNPQTILSLVLQLSLVLLSVAYPLLYPTKSRAAVTEGFVRFNRLSTGEAVSGTACLKSTLTTQTNVMIQFPTDWTISGTASNWTVTTTNLPTDPVGGGAATAWPGIGTASSVSGTTVTFPGTNLAAATFYCFNFAGASSTVGPAGNDKLGELKTQGGAPYTDQMSFATSVVSSGGELITVSASVSATMTFSLDANAQSLGTLSTGTTAQGTPTITESISTNARNGWISWVRSANGALTSVAASASITSPGTYNGTPETLTSTGGYVLRAAVGSGSVTIAPEYLSGGGNDDGGHLGTTFNQLASATAPAASNQVTLITRARSAATTPAASDYTDTLTITAAGSF